MKGLCIVAFACVALAATARASTYHVAVTGNDTAAGSDAAPWRTIQHAAGVVQAGDTVMIHAGTYVGFQVGARGTPAAPITFAGDGVVTIDGTMTSDQDAVHVENASWIEIRGLTVVGATRAGISAITSDHIFVRGNRIDRNGKWGVFSGFCESFVVEGNEVSRSGTQHGIYASNSADDPVISNNIVWGNAMCGIHINGDISQGGDGVISNAIIEGNIIHDNGALGGSGINCDGVVGATIRNNVLDNNHASGISLYQIDGGAPSTGNHVINNTIRMASDARSAINIQNNSTGNTVRNNVLLDTAPNHGVIDVCGGCTSGMASDRNAVVGMFLVDGTALSLAAWHAMTGQDAASFATSEAALFASPATGDLSLRAGSPAIDVGDPDGAPPIDVVGTPRPQGAGFDLGAYEYCDGSCTGSGSGGGSGDGSGSGSDESGSGSGGGDGAPGGAKHTGCSAADPSALATLLVAIALGARRSRRYLWNRGA
jgi:uncharacterized protein (TIGR03382 family)